VENKGPFYDLAFSYRAEEELFDLKTDPECVNNVIKDAKFSEVAKQLRAQLDKTLVEEQDPRALGNGAIFDTYKYLGNREGKGYAEWEMRQKELLPPETKNKKNKTEE
jgi:hypothetical protein